MVFCTLFSTWSFLFIYFTEFSKEQPAVPSLNKSKYSSDKGKKKAEDKLQSAVDKYSLIPEDFKYENKHYKYIKYTKNDVKSYKVSEEMKHILVTRPLKKQRRLSAFHPQIELKRIKINRFGCDHSHHKVLRNYKRIRWHSIAKWDKMFPITHEGMKVFLA